MPASIAMQPTNTTTTTNNNNKRKNTRKNHGKSVAFHQTVRVKEIIHINDYANDEIDACWCSKQDKIHTRQDIANTLRQHNSNSNSSTNNSDLDIRGLECRTKQGSQQRRADRDESISAVLDEQDLQEHEGSSCPDMISAVYADTTRNAQMRANVQAMLDYQVVYYTEHADDKQTAMDMNMDMDTATTSPSPSTAMCSSRQVQSVVLQTNQQHQSMVFRSVAGSAA
uniref:Uncharacterized protein n=1 Tax=Craspedostauros australis TaxID=1486917 RepID=A0A7R9WY23_9STRA|mmetsp:Transcript_3493/g.9281  ORF Transcript_3493/g.9281 Transcript_3493/m.9281 type:complete len:226 (+) Transcript_3493:155-832(+)